MYEHLYSLYEEKVNGRNIVVCIIPNFREDVGIFNENLKVSTSSGDYRIESVHRDYKDIFVPEDTQWVIIQENRFPFTRIIITEYTKKINSDYGVEWNKIFNDIRIKAQKQYYNKKNSEVRLYFWDSTKKRLKLCLNHREFTYCSSESKLSYYHQSFHNGQALDQKYTNPQYDCFILGKVHKTIGTKNGKLFDYIEPISEIKPDFGEQDNIFTSFYYSDIEDLETLILNLLVLCITHTDKGVSAILPNKVPSTSHEKDESSEFNRYLNDVRKALSDGNTQELRILEEMRYKYVS